MIERSVLIFSFFIALVYFSLCFFFVHLRNKYNSAATDISLRHGRAYCPIKSSVLSVMFCGHRLFFLFH